MSIHISALKEDIAPVVLMPGDPLRARFIAENNLENIKQVNSVRNIFYYTGTYKGTQVTIGASGMGFLLSAFILMNCIMNTMWNASCVSALAEPIQIPFIFLM